VICIWVTSNDNELFIAWWSVTQAPVEEQMFVLKFGASYQTGRFPFLSRWVTEVGTNTWHSYFQGLVFRDSFCVSLLPSLPNLTTTYLNRDFKMWLGWGNNIAVVSHLKCVDETTATRVKETHSVVLLLTFRCFKCCYIYCFFCMLIENYSHTSFSADLNLKIETQHS
jgi:hypothetical protein